MADDKNNGNVSELLGDVESTISENSPQSKLKGIESEHPEMIADSDERPLPLRKKSTNKIQLYVGGGALTMVVFAFLILVIDMNGKQNVVESDPTAEAILFDGQGQPFEHHTQTVTEQNGQAPLSQYNAGQSLLEVQNANPSQQTLPPVIPSAPEPMGQASPNSNLSPAEQLQQPVAQGDQGIDQSWNVEAAHQGQAKPLAEDTVQSPKILTPEEKLRMMHLKLEGATTMIVDLTKRYEVLEAKLSEKNTTYVTQKQFLDSMRSLRAIQAQSTKNAGTLKALSDKIALDSGTAVASRTDFTSPAAIRQPTKTSVTSTEINPPSSSGVVVPEERRRQVRQLAWSSYIEDFGVATIEGTADLVELRPGDAILGRGVISKITSTGCILFTNNTRYSPTNGECK